MGYIKAQNVLPEEIIELIQDYIDGELLYIPRKSGNEKGWGETSGARTQLRERNHEIFSKHIDGVSVYDLTRIYYLSEKSIRRIIKEEKLQQEIYSQVLL